MKATYLTCLLFLSVSLLSVISCDNTPENPLTGFIFQEITLQEGDGGSSGFLSATIQGEPTTDISYSIREGSAKFGVDIKDESGTLALADGIVAVPNPVIGDEGLELNETFQIVLEAEGKEFVYEFTIEDDDAIGAILEDQDGYYTPTEYPSMTLTWSEEFDGAVLDADTWTYELGNGCDKNLCGWGNNELQEYTSAPENIRVADGMLTIEATEIPGGYNSARIITQDKVELTYGRIDIRAKMPKGQGLWPASGCWGQTLTMSPGPCVEKLTLWNWLDTPGRDAWYCPL